MQGDLGASFRERFSRHPEGVWAAPGRVNLIGEHTDYNDGFVLPLALNLGVTAAVARRSDRVLRMASMQRKGIVSFVLDGLQPGALHGWSAYVGGVIWALGRTRRDLAGYDILVDGDVPVGAGLSSSAALECAIALAISELEGAEIDRFDLALLAQRAENDFVGVPCGIMDQAASLLCTADHALFLDVRSHAHDQVPVRLDPHGLALLVVDTGARHRLADGAYEARRRSCEEAARELGVPALRDIPLESLDGALSALSSAELRRQVQHVVTENARVVEAVSILRNGRPAALGPVLSRSHASLRDDFQVSSPQLDTAVAATVQAGALGARMTGAGFGGSIIALVEATGILVVAEAVTTAFELAGFATPRFLTATASDGARRIDQ
jgi:galactokinase